MILAILSLLSSLVHGAVTDVNYSQAFPFSSAERNYVKNSCDKSLKYITTSAEVSGAINKTSPLEGVSDCAFTPSNSGAATVTFESFNTEPYLDGKQCEIAFSYKNAGALKWTASSLVAGSVAQTIDLLSSASSVDVSIPFACDSTKTIGIQLATAGTITAGVLNTDRIYIGRLKSPPSAFVSQAQFVASIYMASAASCNWTTTSATLASVGQDADCSAFVAETIKVGSFTGYAGYAKWKLSNLPAGMLVISYTIQTDSDSASTKATGVSDGTTVRNGGTAGVPASGAQISGEVSFEYTEAGDRTFEIFGSSASGYIALNGQTGSKPINITMKLYPPASQIVTPNLTPSWASVKIAANASHAFSTTSATYDKATDTDVVSGDRTNFGSSIDPTTVGDFAVKSPSMDAGTYRACVWGALNNSSTSSATICAWGISDGGTVQDGPYTYSRLNGSADAISGFCQYFTYTEKQSNKEFSLYAKRTTGDGTCYADLSNTGMTIEVTPVSQQVPAVVVANQVSTKLTAPQRIIRGAMQGDCTITGAGTADWSCAHTGTGTYTLTFTPGFANTDYQCSLTPKDSSITVVGMRNSSFTQTASTFGAMFRYHNSATSTAVDEEFSFMCMGTN